MQEPKIGSVSFFFFCGTLNKSHEEEKMRFGQHLDLTENIAKTLLAHATSNLMFPPIYHVLFFFHRQKSHQGCTVLVAGDLLLKKKNPKHGQNEHSLCQCEFNRCRRFLTFPVNSGSSIILVKPSIVTATSASKQFHPL